MSHVFVAYNVENAAFAADLTRQIEDAGFPVWTDDRHLREDEQWREAIDQAIRDAFALVLVLSPESTASELVKYKWMFALGVGVQVILVIVEQTELHPRLQTLPALNFDGDKSPWGKLIRQVQRAHDKTRVSPFARPGQPDRSRARHSPPPDRRPSGSLLERIRRNQEENTDGAPGEQPTTEHPNSIDASQPNAVERLIKALEDGNRDARVAAARKLSEMNDRTAVPGLMKMLRDDDWRVREAAAQALGKMQVAAAVMALLETLRYGRPGPFGGGNHTAITSAICDIGPAAVPVLVDALSDDDWRIRLHATDVLGQIGGEGAVPALVGGLRDPEKRVRWRAAEALGDLGSVEAVPDLIDILRDSSPEVQIAAAWALGRVRHADAISGLIHLLDNRDWRVRWAAAEALWETGEIAIPPLLDILRERRPGPARSAAIRALAEIGAPAVPPLIELLTSDRWDHRCVAVDALGTMGDAAVPALVETLTEANWQVCWAAAETLEQIGTPAALRAVKGWRENLPPGEAEHSQAEHNVENDEHNSVAEDDPDHDEM
ncbi:MAG: TIR domain-containing protein [Chloroflexi bacterium]|nr:TIR domain-containing protein [Chloroflexota bacterium]